MPVGALIGAGTSILNGFLQRGAAKKAADQQAASAAAAKGNIDAEAARGEGIVTGAANNGSQAIRDTLGFNDPYTASGQKANSQLSAFTSGDIPQFSFDPSTLGMDPGYQFRKAEADMTMKQNAGAMGNLYSGGFAEALADRNSADASQEVGNQFNRQLTTFNTNQTADQSRISNLLSLMGFGQKANEDRTAGTEAASGMDLTGALSSAGIGADAAKIGAGLTTGAGTANAVGTANASNATTGMLGNLSKIGQGIDWSSIFKGNGLAAGAKTKGLPAGFVVQ